MNESTVLFAGFATISLLFIVLLYKKVNNFTPKISIQGLTPGCLDFNGKESNVNRALGGSTYPG